MQTKDDLLAAFTREPVEVRAGGRAVHIIALTKGDIRAINAAESGDPRAALVLARSLCTETGTRLLSDEDGPAVADALPHTASEELFQEIAKLNRLGDEAKKAPSPPNPN